MPYLPENRKVNLSKGEAVINHPGDLTYLFTKVLLGAEKDATVSMRHEINKIINRYIDTYGGVEMMRFVNYANIVAAFECTKLEYMRRRTGLSQAIGWRADLLKEFEQCKLMFYISYVAPYEDVKIKENGDVYA